MLSIFARTMPRAWIALEVTSVFVTRDTLAASVKQVDSRAYQTNKIILNKNENDYYFANGLEN